MSRIELPGGDEVYVDVRHSKADILPRYRTTSVKVTMARAGEILGEIEGVSTCSPADNFDRAFGRYQALLRVFAADPDRKLIPREARAKIFRLVVPRITPAMRGVHRPGRN